MVDVLGVFSDDRDAAVRECEALTADPNDQARRNTRELIDWLIDINPMIPPASDGV
jgi:hypothetical protein